VGDAAVPDGAKSANGVSTPPNFVHRRLGNDQGEEAEFISAGIRGTMRTLGVRRIDPSRSTAERRGAIGEPVLFPELSWECESPRCQTGTVTFEIILKVRLSGSASSEDKVRRKRRLISAAWLSASVFLPQLKRRMHPFESLTSAAVTATPT
jgi:hypothetical protein